MIRRLSGTILISLALLAAGCSRSDQQVAAEVQNKINGDSSFPDKGLTVTASKGVITLSGNVSSQSARDAAGKDAAKVDGVKTVVNNLVVAGNAPSASAPPEQPTLQADNSTSRPAPSRAKSSPRVSSARSSSRRGYASAQDNGDVTVRSNPAPQDSNS